MVHVQLDVAEIIIIEHLAAEARVERLAHGGVDFRLDAVLLAQAGQQRGDRLGVRKVERRDLVRLVPQHPFLPPDEEGQQERRVGEGHDQHKHDEDRRDAHKKFEPQLLFQGHTSNL